MSLILYHYVHCPFCVRVRMAAGLLKVDYQSKVLSYDDETTPVSLTGKKMLPILGFVGKAMNESLDIIAFLDKNDVLKVKEVVNSHDFKEFEALLNKLGGTVHSLAMPYWIWTPEFNDTARAYFQKKKEEKRGPFKALVASQPTYFKTMQAELLELEDLLQPFYKSTTFGLRDIMLASHLWGLYVVPEFQFSPKLHEYLQSVKTICDFNYHKDFWS